MDRLDCIKFILRMNLKVQVQRHGVTRAKARRSIWVIFDKQFYSAI